MADAPAPTPEDAPSKASGTPAETPAADTTAAQTTLEAIGQEPEPSPTGAAAPTGEAETTGAIAAAEPTIAQAAPVEPSASTPSLASSIEVPASPVVTPEPDGSTEGGEWDLLVQKLSHWLNSGDWQRQWQTARSPLSLAAALIGLLLVLRVYSAVLGVIDSVPLLPGLLELTGVIAVVQFSLTKLVRSQDRREVIGGLQQRWRSFRGRG